MQVSIIQNEHGEREYMILELQGRVESTEDAAKLLDGQTLGRMQWHADGTAQLIIGGHALSGKLDTLRTPFAVLHRTQPSQPSAADAGCSEAAPPAPFEIVGVVRRRLAFLKRPHAILLGGESNLSKAAAADAHGLMATQVA